MDSETINQGAEVATADSSCSGVLEKIECGTSQGVSAEDRTKLEFNKMDQAMNPSHLILRRQRWHHQVENRKLHKQIVLLETMMWTPFVRSLQVARGGLDFRLLIQTHPNGRMPPN